MVVAVLSSGGASTYDQTFAQEILLKALLSKGVIKEIKPYKSFATPVKENMPAQYKAYAGYYALSFGVLKVDISDSGVLSLYQSETASKLSAQKFVYTGDGKFYFSDGSAYVSFQKDKNGNTYLYVAGYSMLPNIGETATAEYQGQKIEANPISDKIKTVWQKRENKKYFTISEKYSSQSYVVSSLIVQGSMLKGLEGYFGNAAIADENTAKVLLKIPGLYGRDLMDYHFYTKNKVEYLEMGGSVCISEAAVKKLSSKSSFSVKIESNGYAQWYKLGSGSGDKVIQVTLPKKASFSVYDTNGTFLFNSLIAGKTKASLPAGGYIVFAGSAGAKFSLKYIE